MSFGLDCSQVDQSCLSNISNVVANDKESRIPTISKEKSKSAAKIRS